MAKVKQVEARRLNRGDQIKEALRGVTMILTVLEIRAITRGRRAGYRELKMENERGDQWNWKVEPTKLVNVVGTASAKALAEGQGRRDDLDERKQAKKDRRNKKRDEAMQKAEVQPWNYVGMMADIRFRDGNRKRQILRVTQNSVYVRRESGAVEISAYRRDNPERPLTRRDIMELDPLTAIRALNMDDAPKTRRIDIRFLENVEPAEKALPWKLTAADTRKLNKGEAVRKRQGAEFIQASIIVAKDPNVVANRRHDLECASGTTYRDPATGFCWRATGSFD